MPLLAFQPFPPKDGSVRSPVADNQFNPFKPFDPFDQSSGSWCPWETVDEGLIRERAEALGRVEADGALLRARIRSEIWPILSDEQRAKVASFHQMMELKHNKLLGSVEDFLK